MNNGDNQYPDAKKHLHVSLIKSGVRVLGYTLLFGIPSMWAVLAATVLIVSELLGVYEELV